MLFSRKENAQIVAPGSNRQELDTIGIPPEPRLPLLWSRAEAIDDTNSAERQPANFYNKS